MTMLTNYSDITETEEFQNDQELLSAIVVPSFGQEAYITPQTAFVQLLTWLIALARYYIRHQPDGSDIDLTNFLNLVSAEIGSDIPYVPNSINMLELLRENKIWYSNKGNEQLFSFIGDVIGSPIQIEYPEDLIFTLDATRSCLDGAASTHGPLTWGATKLARIEDGYLWSKFTYLLIITDFQNVKSYTDMLALLDAVHPAGIRRILQLIENQEAQGTEVTTILGANDSTVDCYTIGQDWPTLDNSWRLDDPKSRFDMRGGKLTLMHFDVHLT